MIRYSQRLNNVHRVFDPYCERSDFVRLDRNEDPVGYDQRLFDAWKSTLTADDIAAYADSTVLVEKLAKWLGFSQDEITISAGSDALIKNIFEVYIDPGDITVMQKPSWRMYDVYADIYGSKILHIDYHIRHHEFIFDVEALIQLLETQPVKMLVLANPNQPTGTLIKNEDIQRILSVACRHNILVVIDEAYHLFTDVTAIEYTKQYNNLIITRTFSKAFGLAGLRIGYAVAQANRIKDLMLLRPVTDANSLAIHFASYLLDNISVVLDKVHDFNRGRDYLFNELKRNNIASHQSYGNFLLIPCPDETNAKHLIAYAREKKYLLKGPFKIDPINNMIRITTGPLKLMQQFWKDCANGIRHYASTIDHLEKQTCILT